MEKDVRFAVRRGNGAKGEYADVYAGDKKIGEVNVGLNCGYYNANYEFGRCSRGRTADAQSPLEAGIKWVKRQYVLENEKFSIIDKIKDKKAQAVENKKETPNKNIEAKSGNIAI